ncbi:hypothetical protein C4569_02095 [Candidatus Parcubacteria bacterium]|nr:MAG: hypothetical protein C4569_02095 [Candidatus Parcubacteria bacterium]
MALAHCEEEKTTVLVLLPVKETTISVKDLDDIVSAIKGSVDLTNFNPKVMHLDSRLYLAMDVPTDKAEALRGSIRAAINDFWRIIDIRNIGFFVRNTFNFTLTP